MKATFYLIRGNKSESYDSFKEEIFSVLNQVRDLDTVSGLKTTITEEKPPTVSVIPFRKDKIAAIRVIHNPSETLSGLINHPGFSGAFAVEEALPVSYDQNWEGNKTPGICLLTLFRKKKSLKYDTFINRWHNGHTPLSLEIHPLWHYSRNVVEEKVGDHEYWYDGIVEEHCKTRSELFNPFKFFGSPVMILPNMLKVYFDVNSFLDYSSIEPYLVSEYTFK